MDPITIATSFASVVSLIGMFRSERRAADAKSRETYEEFIEWLRSREHDQVVELLQQNESFANQTRQVIDANHDEVMANLITINSIVSDVAAKLHCFGELAGAAGVVSSVSDQSVSILQQLNQLGASCFTESASLGDPRWLIVDGKRGQLNVSESRFIEDDLNRLCEYGLLRMDYTERNKRKFYITRPGAALGNQASYS